MSLPVRSDPVMSGLEQFLLSDIGTQPNGLPLTILTLLARAGLDPWAEAGRLAYMSKAAAVTYMVAEINRVPPACRGAADVGELARRLVDRLPSHEPVKPVDVTAAGTGFDGIPMVALMMMFYAILTMGVLALLLEKS